jgi:uncharacterized protein
MNVQGKMSGARADAGQAGLLGRAIASVVGRPWRALLVAAALLLPMSWPAASVPTDNSLAVWFVRDDPALERYREFLRQFGNDEVVVLAYPAPDGITAAEMELQREVTERLLGVDGVARALSAGSLMRMVPGPAEAVAGVRRLGLVTDDGVMALYAWLEPREDMDARRNEILAGIEAAAAPLVAADRAVRYAGVGVLYAGLNDQTERDASLFLGIAILAMGGLLRMVLGAWSVVALALAAPLVATLAVLGLMGWTGQSLNVVMAALPALLLVIGVAAAVHVLTDWFRTRRERPPATVAERRSLAVEVVARIAVPTLVASGTTALAFLALVSSRMAVIRAFGAFAAVGVLGVWVLTMLACALGLSLLDIDSPERTLGTRVRGWLATLGSTLARRRGVVWACFGAATVVLLVGASRVVVDTHTLGLLPDDHRVVRHSDWIEANLGPYTPLEFVVRPPGGNALSPDALAGIRLWQAAAESRSWVGRTLAVTDLLALAGALDGELGADAVAAYRTATGDDLSDFLTPDRRFTRATAFVPMGTARDFEAAVRALRADGDRAMGQPGSFTPAGYLPLYVRIIDYTVSSTLMGLGLAFLAVFLVLGLLLRSPRLVLAAVPTNLFAVAMVFGVMGWLAIPLDIATATVGAIVLGIAVDDTVHYLHRYRLAEVAGAADPAVEALTGAGPAMVLTSVVLVLGLGVLVAAGSLSIAYFGMLTALAVTAALVADLILLPTLLGGRRS